MLLTRLILAINSLYSMASCIKFHQNDRNHAYITKSAGYESNLDSNDKFWIEIEPHLRGRKV
jgi:hypothetical protein